MVDHQGDLGKSQLDESKVAACNQAAHATHCGERFKKITIVKLLPEVPE